MDLNKFTNILWVAPLRSHVYTFLAVLTFLHVGADLVAQPVQVTRFAVIGDYGWTGQPEADVATLVRGWNPDLIITTGDNNYDSGASSTIDQNIGQYYHWFIFPYIGGYGQGDTVNRFFPSLGNHDWVATGALPYLSYFTLPGNERYYDFVKGNVQFFCIDSDTHEPDGTTSSSTQGQWLQNRLANSTVRWKIVYFHHPPYSSGTTHGSSTYMRWPFQQWGATAVLNGHEHNYERLIINNLPYFVNGLGGRSLYSFGTPISGSVIRYNADYGAQLVTANEDSLVFEFFRRSDALIDRYVIIASERYAVAAGWNLQSLPLTVADRTATVVYPSATSPAWAFEYPSGYVSRDTLKYGEGYWIEFPSAQEIALTGTHRRLDTISVRAGWNLIGSISYHVVTSSIVQIPPDIVGSEYFGYNGVYAVADTLEPGKGYWVRVTQDGKLVFH